MTAKEFKETINAHNNNVGIPPIEEIKKEIDAFLCKKLKLLLNTESIVCDRLYMYYPLYQFESHNKIACKYLAELGYRVTRGNYNIIIAL